MGTRMSLETRRELLEQLKERYRWANRSERSRILDDFTASTDYARKHAIVLLNTSCPVRAPQPSRRRKYDEQVRQALTQLWNVANQICSKRLVPFLPDLIESMRRHGHLSLPKEVHSKLLTISPATMDRLLKPERAKLHKTLSATRPGSLLKKQIRVRTFADWDEGLPGFFEADLVVHCGESMAGSYLHTLVLVDIATGWTECVALLRRSEADVIGALTAVSKRLPFPLLGLDTDNGSEFINYEMLKFCRREQITFTRSRAYKKNDQAYVEEKNGSVVRRLIGYDRYEGLEAWRALTKLYSVLRDYQNFFQPSMKLQSKSRSGGDCYEAIRFRPHTGATPTGGRLSESQIQWSDPKQVEAAGSGHPTQTVRRASGRILEVCQPGPRENSRSCDPSAGCREDHRRPDGGTATLPKNEENSLLENERRSVRRSLARDSPSFGSQSSPDCQRPL